MKRFTGIAITDGLNRENQFLPTGALLNAYQESWQDGTPTNIGHDSTKFLGWNILSGMYFEPEKSYVTNKLYVPENDEDKKQLAVYSGAFYVKKYVEGRKEQYKELLSRIKEVSDTINPHIAPLVNAVAYEDKDIVLKICPEVRDNLKEGLVPLSLLKVVFPGIYEVNGFLVFANRLFRRSGSLLNALNDAFLSRFQEVSSELNPRISIDLDLVGLPGTASQEFEYQYWWGPKFDDDLKEIEQGVTCNNNEKYDNLFSNIQRTEFFWHPQDDRKTFECEEIRDVPDILDGEEKFRCRYVHSMMDPDSKNVVHLDGAIRAYSEETMLDRLDVDISKAGHHTEYSKLWRLDGALSVPKWKELITHYFRDNMLIGEYFHGEDENYRQIVIEEERKKRVPEEVPAKKYIPVDLHAGDGLRMFFCFEERHKESEF